MNRRRLMLIAVVMALLAGVACGPVPTIPPEDEGKPVGTLDAKWYTGTGPPAASLGADGDLYLDTSVSFVFVKVSGLWVNVASLQGPQGPSGPGIGYWFHEITASDQVYVPGTPYGVYRITITDDRLGAADWVDLWVVDDSTGANNWRRLAPFYSETLGIWYYIWYTYRGALVFQSPMSEVGTTIVIFKANTTKLPNARTTGSFDAAEYFRSLAQ